MTVLIPASEVAVGDYSPVFGTVTKVTEHRDKKTNELQTIDFTFFNTSYEITGALPDYMMEILQGGAEIIHDGMPDKSQIRPGLAADHAQD